jgi:hypothetical protein
MSLDSHAFLSRAVEIKHLTLKGREPARDSVEFVPRIYFAARIDLSDVRSGLRGTYNVSRAFDLFPMDGDTLWTQDMVRDVDPAHLESGMPEAGKARPLPAFFDAEFLQRTEGRFFSYLMRYYGVRVYRNFTLNAYSALGENLQEFKHRCAELLGESFRKELKSLHEVFQRKLEQTREKCLKDSGDPITSRDFEETKRVVHWKSRVHDMSEKLAEVFLKTELTLTPKRPAESLPAQNLIEPDDRLQLLELEAQQQIYQLVEQYLDKVQAMDEHVIHPNLKDIHLVRTCILWMPTDSARLDIF